MPLGPLPAPPQKGQENEEDLKGLGHGRGQFRDRGHLSRKLGIYGAQALSLLPQGELAQKDRLLFHGISLPLELEDVSG